MHSRRLAPLAGAALALAVVVGQITDKTTGQPLPGVEVMFLHKGDVHGAPAVYTNVNGNYRVRNLRPGPYRVTITSSDVPTKTFPTTIGPKESTHRLDRVACSITLDYTCNGP